MTSADLRNQYEHACFQVYEAMKAVDAVPGRIMGFKVKGQILRNLDSIEDALDEVRESEHYESGIEELSHDEE